MHASNNTTQRNYYDDLTARALGNGLPLDVAVERAASAYLDGKPATQGQRKLTRKERASLFSTSANGFGVS